MSVTEGLLEPFGYGLGYPDVVDLTTPALGANASVPVAGEYQVRVLAAIATLTTDANAANRLLSLDYINQRGVTLHRNGASVLVTANTTAQVFVWGANRSVAEWNTGTPVWVPLLPIFLQPGYSVQFTVDNKQAGDQLSALHLMVERFETGERGYPVGVVEAPRRARRRA